ncbi:cell wall-binding repeat-containing protein [Clostridium sp.]|uniref:cell wall-binding repeat-containing protein n=1 Tax=Clostridium sp. TaxID=1506 RepID=UPI0029079380|nr:cell wall-binding repeat-containing protein [Clostridium sp.]MDU5107773.1 cell wall-binding repeat-containing protein [Clostridium sp.]
MKKKRNSIIAIVLALTFIGEVYLSYISSNATNTVIKKLSGSDRYATTVELSKKQFSSSSVACIVNGSALPDGLTITPLATYYKAPILLSQSNSLPQSTKDELKRLKVTKVFIGGSNDVVSENVVKELKTLGVQEVIRLGGADRYGRSYASELR